MAALSGCSLNHRSPIWRDEDYSPRQLRRVAVAPFGRTAQGRVMAQAVAAALGKRGLETANIALVDRIFTQHSKGFDKEIGFEALELLRQETGADSLIMGSATADGKSATFQLLATEMADPLVRGSVKGADAEATAEEVAKAIVGR